MKRFKKILTVFLAMVMLAGTATGVYGAIPPEALEWAEYIFQDAGFMQEEKDVYMRDLSISYALFDEELSEEHLSLIQYEIDNKKNLNYTDFNLIGYTLDGNVIKNLDFDFWKSYTSNVSPYLFVYITDTDTGAVKRIQQIEKFFDFQVYKKTFFHEYGLTYWVPIDYDTFYEDEIINETTPELYLPGLYYYHYTRYKLTDIALPDDFDISTQSVYIVQCVKPEKSDSSRAPYRIEEMIKLDLSEDGEYTFEAKPMVSVLPEHLYGDADGSRTVDLKDVTVALKYIAKWDVTLNLTLTDLNLNRYVDLSDVSMILKIIAGWEDIII